MILHKLHLATGLLLSVVLGSGTILGAEESENGDQPTQNPLGDPVDFRQDIRPLLTEHCFRCHGPDEATVEAGLRLDLRERAIAELESGVRAVAPGDAEQSELLARIEAEDPDERMPPADAGPQLDSRQRALLRRWIEQGAPYARHWSFDAPLQPSLPTSVSEPRWARNPIDLWVLERMDAQQLAPSRPADPYTLVRRVSLAITGLPPRPEDVEAFRQDPSPQAYDALVDALLQSPAYGERWGRVWLDLARYADSAGYAQDPARTIWRYRDWVISALNANLPFDRFTIEQLAGDLLPNPTDEQLIATAFHRNTMTNSEGGTDDEEFRNAAVVDRVNTTLQVWMGLTMGCAQCHTHKYDPITQEEYFQVFAILNNTQDADRGDESPVLETWSAEQQVARDDIQHEIRELEQWLAEHAGGAEAAGATEPTIREGQPPEPLSEAELRVKQQRAQLKTLQQGLANIRGVTTPILRELPPDKQRMTRLQLRGNFRDTAQEVEPGVPAYFHPLMPDAPPNRKALAEWITCGDNPLTARVTVNRVWEQLFGVGLVETSEDFGLQGSAPSHPELLDWLAVELVQNKWDLKWLIRTLVTSATYRQTSAVSPELVTQDPSNRWLARGPRFRLPAEMIRDQTLQVAGLLSRKLGGPPVRPPQPKLGLRAAFGGSTDWETSPGEDRYRRGLYTQWRRTSPYAAMITFDAPSREFCTVRRIRTNTPLQALVTLNDEVYVEAAQALARRIIEEGGSQPDERANFGLQACLCRPARPEETARLVALYHESVGRLRDVPDQAERLATEPLGPLSAGEAAVELAAWTVVGNVLLNLDEFLARP